jgi:hypothetical protein
MDFSNWYRLIILLIIIMMPWQYVTQAKIVFVGNGTYEIYSSADFFFSSQDYYSGIALEWSYEYDTQRRNCFFPQINASDLHTKKLASELDKYRNIALIINYRMSITANCKEKEQVIKMMQRYLIVNPILLGEQIYGHSL